MINFVVIFPIIANLSMPINVPTSPVGMLWALPISLMIAVVYKAVKLETFTPAKYAREVALLFATIVGFLAAAAVGLILIDYLVRL